MNDELNPYQAPVAFPVPAPVSGEPCDFTDSQRARIGKLAGRLQFVGGATLALTALHTVAMMLHHNYLPAAGNVFQFAAGYFALQSGSAFRRVLVARSQPLPEMRRALENLRGFYTVYFVLIVLTLLFVVGMFGLLFVGIGLGRRF